MKRVILAALALVILAVAAPSAFSATYTVYAGEQSRTGAPPIATQNRFMPGVVYIHAGDSVKFTTPGGHTVSFVGPTLPQQLKFFAPAPGGATYAG